MIYVNEIDPYCAQWLQNLMDAGVLPPGHIDTRSIEDVTPNDLAGYTQCHFFAGLGGWIYALDLAGWPRDRPVWTGSCPCQPFSAAGKGAGFADERHLWPAWQHLIAQRKPATVFGEQVASKDADAWIDLVHADMEGLGYAFGSVPFPATGIGAPHIRDRNYWMAHADGRNASAEREQRSGQQRQQPADGGAGRMADANGGQQQGVAVLRGDERNGPDAGWPQGGRGAAACGEHDVLADSTSIGWIGRRTSEARDEPAAVKRLERLCDAGRLADTTRSGRREERANPGRGAAGDRAERLPAGLGDGRGDHGANPLHGFWRSADWLGCTDGKWRPVEASPQPLVDGLPESLGRVCAATIAEVEAEVVSYAAYRKTSAAEELRNLCEALDAQAQRGWSPGGLPGLHSPAFLLAFVCQLAAQGWRLAQGLPLSGSQDAGAGMRVLWDNEAAARASRQRGLEGQPARERTDALHLLSPILARHAQASWGKAYSAYAEIGFPLGHNAPARVGRLRAYGNAIVPQAAAEFVAAFMNADVRQSLAAA